MDFLFTREAQEVFAKYGLRSVDPEVAEATAASIRRWKICSPSIISAAGVKPRRLSSASKASLPRRSPKSTG